MWERMEERLTVKLLGILNIYVCIYIYIIYNAVVHGIVMLNIIMIWVCFHLEKKLHEM